MFVQEEVKKLSLPVHFRWMEVSEGKQSTWLYLDTSHLCLLVATKHVMVLVILYNETFPARVVEDFLLLSQPLRDLSFDRVWGTKLGLYHGWGVQSKFQVSTPYTATVCLWLFTGVVFFSPQELENSVHLFPCVFIQWGCCYSVDVVLVWNFLYWWIYLLPCSGTKQHDKKQLAVILCFTGVK